jgi:hypothetical protein
MDNELHHGQYGQVRIDPTGVGGGEGTNEVQTVTISGTPAGGSFTLTFDGVTTAAIPYNATAAVVQAALLALPAFREGDVVVTGSAGGPYTLTFGDDFAAEDVATLTTAGSFTGGSSPAVAVTTATPGVASPIAIVESCNSWSYSGKRDRVDVTCFGNHNKVKVLGLPDISGAIAGFFNSANPVLFDVADGTVPALLRLVPYKLEPTHYFQGLAYLDASIKVDGKGAVAVDANWDAAGDWARA